MLLLLLINNLQYHLKRKFLSVFANVLLLPVMVMMV